MGRSRALGWVEAQLGACRGSRARRLIAEWRSSCPELADGLTGCGGPAEIAPQVWEMDRVAANGVLRALVVLAQRGDEYAVLVVLACLRPGLRAMARRPPVAGGSRSMAVALDDVVAAATARVLEFPVARRHWVASGLLLDVWHELWVDARDRGRAWETAERCLRDPCWSWDTHAAARPEASATDMVVRLVVDAHREGVLDGDEARLIVETRVLDEPMTVAARRRGLESKTAYKRRRRAEVRLAETVAA